MELLQALMFMLYGMMIVIGVVAIPLFIIIKITGGMARSTVKTTRKIFR